MILNIYCYNCAKKGHYGDDCDLRRHSKVPNDDGSAFTGDNLPTALKDKYWKALKLRSYNDYKSDYNDFNDKTDYIDSYFLGFEKQNCKQIPTSPAYPPNKRIKFDKFDPPSRPLMSRVKQNLNIGQNDKADIELDYGANDFAHTVSENSKNKSKKKVR